MILAEYGNGYKQTQRIYSIDGPAPTIWNMSHDPYKIAVPIKGEREVRLRQVATLSQGGFDIRKRVYSPDGIAPTVYTCGGGGTEPKILVEAVRC